MGLQAFFFFNLFIIFFTLYKKISIGKCKRANKSQGKKNITSYPAISCNKAEKSTIMFSYSLSQWIKFYLINNLRYDLPEGAWSNSSLWGISQNQTDILQGVNARRSHRICFSVAAEVSGAFGTNPAYCLWLSAGKGPKCTGPVAAGAYCQYYWWGGRSWPEPWQVCMLSLSHHSSQLSRGGQLNCLAEEMSPIFLTEIIILVAHPGDEKTASSWCRKVR